jgi:beta-lactamase superfamily II metal-dependent hydrolase
MIVNIYDVGHGFCGYIRDQLTGANLLFDCGYNERTSVHPVDEILRTYGAIGGLVIQNADEDHLDGLPRLITLAGATPARVLFSNPSLTIPALLSVKAAPFGNGLLSLLQLKRRYTAPLAAGTGVRGEVSISQYWNPYPLFTDTNNLSLVTFVHSQGYSVIFAGDLERAGWRMLLRSPAFIQDLARVRVYVASHHGRDNGYCEEVFDHCWPELVVISDGEIRHDTQDNCYARHARGVSFGGEMRYVLTTRCDGDIRISPGGGFAGLVTTSAAA